MNYFFVLVVTAGVAVAVTSTEALARSEVCHAATEPQIASLFDRWNRSLQTGDPKKVVANYATKSVLLPTVSNTPRLTPATEETELVHIPLLRVRTVRASSAPARSAP